jgi:hypothetical protein
MREMDTYTGALDRLARDPGLYQLVVKDVHATAVRTGLPPEWVKTNLETADGFPEPGT